MGQLFGQGGVLGEEDRAEALEVLQTRFGISEAEAESFLDGVQARAEEVQAEAEQAIEEARAAATEAAEQASEAASTAGFLAFFASLLGLDRRRRRRGARPRQALRPAALRARQRTGPRPARSWGRTPATGDGPPRRGTGPARRARSPCPARRFAA